MSKEKISDILGKIDSKYIDEASDNSIRSASKRHFVRWSTAAACIAAFIVIGCGALVFVSEAKEYKAAVSFFEESGLSTEGLSRSDIKAVYRDITTKKFSNNKTAEVIRDAVLGMEIDIEDDRMSAEELYNIWLENERLRNQPKKEYSYIVGGELVGHEYPLNYLDFSYIECYYDGELLWRNEFKSLCINGYADSDVGVMVWGRSSPPRFSDEKEYSWIATIDNSGNVIMQSHFDHGIGNEDIFTVMYNGDGTWGAISRANLRYLCLTNYDCFGNELNFNKTDIGNRGIWNAALFGDGYIVQVGSLRQNETALIYKMDRNGNITDEFSFESEDCRYYITDMIEFAGNIYLSAKCISKYGGSYGCDLQEWENDPVAYDEKVTKAIKRSRSAVLLICNPDDGNPETFYYVKESQGAQLSVNASNQLEWNVDTIMDVHFSPYTNSFSFSGNCQEFRLTFDSAGSLIEKTVVGGALFRE